MSESAGEVFVAVRCDQLSNPVFGSRIVLCEWCQCRVWIAPSGLDLVWSKAMAILCQRHAMARARLLNDGLVAIAPFTSEQVREVVTSLGRNN
mgnify:CR=1 FL=1